MLKSLLLLTFILPVAAMAQSTQITTQGKVTFKVQYSFGTNNSLWMQEYQDPSDQEIELRQQVDNIALNFHAPTQRTEAIGNLCQGRTFDDAIRMGRYLGDQFFSGHNYQNNNGANTNQIWQAYHNRIKYGDTNQIAGKSSDHALAIGQFLSQCGISSDRISIEEFKTAKGAHQLVNVLGDDGKLYSLNYSELYSTDYNPFFSSGLETSAGTIGIKHTRYDVHSGKAIDTRMTELGHILMAVTGGRIDDPDYIPDLLQLEGNYSVMTAGAYMGSTLRGEMLKGVKLAYEQRPLKWLHLKAGLTYAHVELNNASLGRTGATSPVGSHILFMQFRGTIDIPDLQLLKKDDHRLFIDTNLDISAGLALMWSNGGELGDKTQFNNDQFNLASLESFLVYRNNNIETKVGGGIESSMTAGGMFPYPFMRGKFIQGEFTLKGDRLDIKAGSKIYFFSYGLDQRYYLAFLEKKNFLLFNVGVSNHTNNAGKNYPFLTTGIKKEFDINKIGKIGIGLEAMTPLSKDPDYRIMFGVSYTPDFKDHKKPNPEKDRESWRLRRQQDEKN